MSAPSIIALSLGLAPIPDAPPRAMRRRVQILADTDHAGFGELARGDGAAVRAQILDLIRAEGSATAAEVCSHFGMSLGNAKHHLYGLRDAGLVWLEQRREAGTLKNIYHAEEVAP